MLRHPRHGSRGVPRRPSTVSLLAICLTTYFGYHAIEGRHGLAAHSRLIERSNALEHEIRALEAVRSRLQREVRLLDLDAPDPDYVDEIARRLLGFAHPRDRILVTTQPAR